MGENKEIIGRYLCNFSIAIFLGLTILLLVLDTAIFKYGSIGFLTAILYYLYFIGLSIFYFLGKYLQKEKLKNLMIVYWIILATWPLLLNSYGYRGPIE